jgi:hypothetical protein
MLRTRTATAIALVSSVMLSCDEGDEFTPSSELEGLRILAIQSEPPDLAPGETAELRAAVYSPEGEVRYQWSWCPGRGDEEADFECTLPEADLHDAWEELGTGDELPPYDLGTSADAQFENPFTAEAVSALCEVLAREPQGRGATLVNCSDGLPLSFELKVRSEGVEKRALKVVPLVPGPSTRNANPVLPERMAITRNGRTVDRVQAGKFYEVRLDLDPEVAEEFQPDDESRRRTESLAISWFVYPGSTGFSASNDGFLPLGPTENTRTRLEGGDDDFSEFSRNGWGLPPGTRASEGVVFAVLRDDRGGVAWLSEQLEVDR